MYIEETSTKDWKRLLILTLVLLTVPLAWIPELNEREAIIAVAAQEMMVTKNYLIPHFHATPAELPPLATWLPSAFYHLFGVSEFSTRLVSIFSLGLLALMCGRFTYIIAGPRAAAAATAAVLSSLMSIRKGISGDGDIVFCLLINGSWLAWYIFSRDKRKWLYAWSIAHFLIYLAYLNSGIKALFFFYFPLIWLRRPLKALRRMAQPDHIVSLSVLLLFGLIWAFMSRPDGVSASVITGLEGPESISANYFLRLISFPFACFAGFLPWSLLVWPAYCMAFIPLEKDAAPGQFLRTICISLFYFFWLFPVSSYEILLPLIGPLSIQLGVHYELLVRRYGNQLAKIPGIIVKGCFVSVPIAWVLIPLIPSSSVSVSRPAAHLWIFYTGVICVTVGFGSLVIKRRFHTQIWLAILVAASVFYIGVGSTCEAIGYVIRSDNRKTGEKLSHNLPPHVKLYNTVVNNGSFPEISYYLKRPIIAVEGVQGLPRFDDTIYIIGQDRMPISQNYEWTPISEALQYKEVRLRLWKGERRILDILPDRLIFQPRQGNFLSTYEPQKIQITNQMRNRRFKEINIYSRAGYITFNDTVFPGLEPGQSLELTVHVKPGAIQDEPVADRIFIEAQSSDNRFTRTIEVTIKVNEP